MAGVVQRQFDVGRDVGHVAVLQRDGVFDGFADHLGVVRRGPTVVRGSVQIIQRQQAHQVPRRLGAVDWAVVAVLEQQRDQRGVVQMRVGQDDGVDAVGPGPERLRNVQIRLLAVGTGLVTAVDEDSRVRRREDKGGAADLSAAAQRRDADVLVVGHRLAVDLPADAFEDVPAVLALLFEEVPDVLDRRGLDGGRSNDFGRPADLLRDVTQGRAAPANDDAGLLGLDDDFAGVGVEIQVHDAGLLGDEFPNRLLSLGWRGQYVRVRADRDSLAEFRREPANEVAVRGELLRVPRVYDEFRSLVRDIRDGDTARDFLVDRCLHVFELLVYSAHSSKRGVIPVAGPSTAGAGRLVPRDVRSLIKSSVIGELPPDVERCPENRPLFLSIPLVL